MDMSSTGSRAQGKQTQRESVMGTSGLVSADQLVNFASYPVFDKRNETDARPTLLLRPERKTK